MRPDIVQTLSFLTRESFWQSIPHLTVSTDTADVNRQDLFKLLQISKQCVAPLAYGCAAHLYRLMAFENSVNEIESVVRELLNSDDDMSQMYLSDAAKTGFDLHLDLSGVRVPLTSFSHQASSTP
jgi:hypothetical protein